MSALVTLATASAFGISALRIAASTAKILPVPLLLARQPLLSQNLRLRVLPRRHVPRQLVIDQRPVSRLTGAHEGLRGLKDGCLRALLVRLLDKRPATIERLRPGQVADAQLVIASEEVKSAAHR